MIWKVFYVLHKFENSFFMSFVQGVITIFFEQIKKLCLDRDTTPTALCKSLGLSTAMPTNWKCGRIPSGTTLLKIANYFGVSTDYLLGNEEQSARSADSVFSMSKEEQRIILTYRENEAFREAVNAILRCSESPR